MTETVDRESLWVEPKAEAMFDASKGRSQAPGEACWQGLDDLIDAQARQRQREEEEKGETRAQKEAREYRERHQEDLRDQRRVNQTLWVRYFRRRQQQARQEAERLVEHYEQQVQKLEAIQV